ncbi:MAG: hypothetical protein WCA20_03005 [Candidatus Sulfotelmatobacter sp.]
MSALLATAPALDEHRIDQIAALPLGGRIKLDPRSDPGELAKARPVTLALAREKMPLFEITPSFPLLKPDCRMRAARRESRSAIPIEFAREPASPSLSG